MNEFELIQSLHSLNDSEQFYLQYQLAKKNPSAFRRFLKEVDIEECVRKHYVIPEISATMPDAMRDEYFFSDPQIGMLISKHNCYSPVFQHFHSPHKFDVRILFAQRLHFLVADAASAHFNRLDAGEKFDSQMNVIQRFDFFVIQKQGVGRNVVIRSEKVEESEWEAWKSEYPEAFERAYDPAVGRTYDSWVVEGE